MNAEELIKAPHGRVLRKVCALAGHKFQGLHSAARQLPRDKQHRWIRKQLFDLDTANAWVRHINSVSAVELEGIVDGAFSSLHFSCPHALVDADVPNSLVTRGVAVEGCASDGSSAHSPHSADAAAGGASDTDAELTHQYAEFFDISDGSRGASVQTDVCILPQASAGFMCDSAPNVVLTAMTQVASDLDRSFAALHAALEAATEHEDYMAMVLPPYSPGGDTSPDSLHDAFDDPTAICFQVRRLVHAVDCAMYDAAERSADDDGNFDLFMALPRRFLTRYDNHGAVESSEISSYLDAPWGDAAWGRLRTFDSSGCDVTEALDRYGL